MLRQEKNAVSRILNNIGNKTTGKYASEKEAYNAQYKKALRAYDAADAEWAKTEELRAKTGKTAVTRLINNIKYSD